MGCGALDGKRDTTRNNEEKWVGRIATERGAFVGVIFFKIKCSVEIVFRKKLFPTKNTF